VQKLFGAHNVGEIVFLAR